uniref:Uncharacterized protein n=1 Tax=Nelumbo nucifera TaxID=4432 RepID=A0A822XZZ5_NELNU|nr:TPA_asm: hypothetical protein HUJ06_026787 [Nelumbo nucifera]
MKIVVAAGTRLTAVDVEDDVERDRGREENERKRKSLGRSLLLQLLYSRHEDDELFSSNGEFEKEQ